MLREGGFSWLTRVFFCLGVLPVGLDEAALLGEGCGEEVEPNFLWIGVGKGFGDEGVAVLEGGSVLLEGVECEELGEEVSELAGVKFASSEFLRLLSNRGMEAASGGWFAQG